ncbi:MAG TPA: SCO family protein [Pseudomonas sp.]|uniref:SCO family protein n=1 Tax=Pseudomonas sp. TaxID=306 RepID=UPI002ED87DC2
MTRRELMSALLTGLCLPLLAAPRLSQAAHWLPSPVLPPVSLVDQHNQPRSLADLLDRQTVAISFMFTGCATVCPPQTALLRAAYQRSQADPRLRDLRIISITVDPYGDGPSQLRAYAERFQLPAHNWILLTGDADDVDQVLRAFDVSSTRLAEHPPLLWLGDTRRNRWTRTSSLNSPQIIVELLQELSA